MGRVGGGVAIYVKKNMYSSEMTELKMNGIESVWVKVHAKGVNILFGVFYRPPDSENHIWDHINYSIDMAISKNIDNVVICGDLNEDQLNPRKIKIRDICLQNSLTQIITEPTYFHESSASLLDLIMVNDSNMIAYYEVGENILGNSVRYHCPVSAIINIEKSHQKSMKRKIWQYHRGNYDSFNGELNNTDWDGLIDDTDLDSAVNNVTNKILTAAENSIPHKMIWIRKSDPPWMNGLIRKTIRKRRRLHSKAKRTNSDYDWAKYRKIRNKCVNLVKSAKDRYIEIQTSSLDSPSLSIHNWWKLLKNVLGTASNKSDYPPLNVEGEIVENDIDKGIIFSTFCCRQSCIDDSEVDLPEEYDNIQIPKLDNIHITEQDIKDILIQLNISKASGPDLLNPRLLKEAANTLKYPLYKLFNKSLQLAQFPNVWKLANVIPVFKNKGEKDCLSNYRPISLLSIIGKVMEKCIFKYIYNFLITYCLITIFQSGFRPGDSTVNQLLCIINDFAKAIDEGKEIRIIFCDISKAFDRVWHKGLLHKLKQIGIDGQLLCWFESYLSERHQQVVISGATSETKSTNAGVPQGSILGPILFLIYINDIVNDISSYIKLFADDTSLYLIVDNDEYQAAEQLNNDIEKIHQWSKNWLVKFNPEKTEIMTISKKINKPHHPPVYMNNVIIKEVDTHKHLGVTISEDGSWNVHINTIMNKVSQRLSMFRKVKFKLKRLHLQTIYFSFIRPIMEYADIVWDNIPEYLKQSLENLQLEAARIVTGGNKLSSKQLLYEETGWETLQSRRNKHKLNKFHEMFHKNAPDYLNSLVPLPIAERHNYNTRQTNDIVNINCRTSYYQNSFLPSSVKLWNNLPLEVRNNQSKYSFKHFLNRNLVKIPKYYNFGCRKSQILLARLRLQSSLLKDHLFRKNIIDSNLCTCGGVENTEHYFLRCPNYSNIRNTTIFLLGNINVRTLLFGNNLLSEDENRAIFTKVSQYILQTKRFD